MRIGIVGAGAIGGWLGIQLALAGHDVSVLARGAVLEAISNDGWWLEMGGQERRAEVRASDDAARLGIQDVLLICLKGPALHILAPQIAAMIGPDTLVVPMMNGVPWWFVLDGAGQLGPTRLESVDPAGAIVEAIPSAQIIGAVLHCSVSSPRPGRVVHKTGNHVILGEPAGPATPRLERLCATLQEAGIGVEQSDRIRYMIWHKLLGNITINPTSALTGATADRILDDPLVARFIVQIMEEVRRIGADIGCQVTETAEERNAFTRSLGAFKTSMLQDVEAGKPLEIDQLLMAPQEIARALDLETPGLDALIGLTRLFAKTRGLYQRAVPNI